MDPSPSDSIDSPPKPPAKFQLLKWNSVAVWSWNIKDEMCAICRNHLMELCIECITKPDADPSQCTLAWGQCNHAFHFHCISRWLKDRTTCPLDNGTWEYKRLGKDSGKGV